MDVLGKRRKPREQRVPDERQQHRLPNRQNESVIAGVTQVIARSQCAYRSMGASAGSRGRGLSLIVELAANQVEHGEADQQAR